ncbi:hypothetical protein [Ammoniphilus sp. 3BR4]
MEHKEPESVVTSTYSISPDGEIRFHEQELGDGEESEDMIDP